MKKTFFIILSCCLLLCAGCKKEDFVSNTYKASFNYHFNNPNNQHSVEILLNNYNTVWMSEIELTLISTASTDIEAKTKFATSVTAVLTKGPSLMPFFDDNDYMIYTLERTTSGNEKTLRQVKFFKGSNGKIDHTNL
jgi:hypothetical protein